MNTVQHDRKYILSLRAVSFLAVGLLAAYTCINLAACTDPDKNASDHIPDTAHTGYIDQLNQSAFMLWSSNPDSLILLSNKALQLSTDLDYRKGKATAFMILGAGYYEKGAYTQSVDYYQQAIQSAQAIPNDTLAARSRNNISMPLIALGAYEEAIENVLGALALGERHDLPDLIAHTYNNLGMVYHYQQKYDQALDYYQKSKSAYKAIGDSTTMTFILGNMAHIHLNRKEYQEARKYYRASLNLAQQYDNQKGIGNALLSLGAVYMEEGNTVEALDYLFKAKHTLEALGEKTEYLRLLQNFSQCYLLLEDRQQALHYARQGYELAEQQQQLWYVKTFAETLAELYEQTNNFERALSYQKTANNTADSLSNLDKKEQIVRLEEKYKYEKHQHEIESAYTNQLNRKQNLAYLLAGSAIALGIIVTLLLYNVRQKKTANQILRQTNEHIAQQHTLLEKADGFKSHLISIVAHDIRTPIATLRMILNLVDDDFLPKEKRKQLIASSNAEVTSLAHFVDNLLLWVMRQLREEKTEKSLFDICILAKETLILYQLQAQSKHIDLSMQIQEHTKVYADMETLKIVLRNLVDNALKFCRPGDQIMITAEPDESTGKVLVRVSDTGCGMEAEVVENLFSLSPSNTTTNNRKGLGLILCQQYLEMNDSALFVESEPGKGSTFWFLLPKE